jgi:hypothetical protein
MVTSRGANVGDALGELIIVIIGTIIAGKVINDYESFKKAAIIKTELDGAVTYLKEDRLREAIPINRGSEFLRASADSIFGDREWEIRNMYDKIEKYNSEISGMPEDQISMSKRSLINEITGLKNQKRMKELPFIGSLKKYIKYKFFMFKLYFHLIQE